MNYRHVVIIAGERGPRSWPALEVDGRRCELNQTLDVSLGFTSGCTLTPTLFRVLVVLALRVRVDPGGWVTTEELDALAGGGAGSGGVKRSMSRWLSSYGSRDERAGHDDNERPLESSEARGHLIQHAPRIGVTRAEARDAGLKQGRAGGKSGGPYRLGAGPGAVDLDERECWSFLLNRSIVSSLWPGGPELGAEGAKASLQRGDLLGGRRQALAALIRAFTASAPRGRDRLLALAGCWWELGALDMELGSSEGALMAADLALRLYRQGHSPFGEAEARQLRAHAHLQVHEIYSALREAERARFLLDQALMEVPRDMWELQRAAYDGTVGQMRAAVGALTGSARTTRKAEVELLHAYDVNVASGRGASWGSTYAARLALNLVEASKHVHDERARVASLSKGESFLEWAEMNGRDLTVPMRALLLRSRVVVDIAAAQWTEAERHVAMVVRFAEEHGLEHLKKEIVPLAQVIQGHFDR